MNRFGNILFAACMTAYMVGARDVVADVRGGVPARLANDWREPAQYLQDMAAVTPERYEELEYGYRKYAFTVSSFHRDQLLRLARDFLLKEAKNLLVGTVSEGKGAEAYRQALDELSRRAGIGPTNPFLAETIFRTNVATAYGCASYDLLHQPSVAEEFPLFMFDGVADDRQSDICRAIDGVILPREHVFWQTHWPPLHFRCRSRIRPLHLDQTKDFEVTPGDRIPSSAPDVEDGFGFAGGAEKQWAIVERIRRNG